MKPFLLVAACMGLDLLTFALVVPHVGIGAESNPLMAQAYIRFGLIAVGVLKIAFTVVILYGVGLVKVDSRLRFATAMFGASIGLLGAAGNIIAWQS